MYFHEKLAVHLCEHGMKDLFGLMGDANLFMIDAFVRHSGGSFHSVSYEGSAVLAAIGYAEVTGEVGFATVTHGPAFTNTITALIEGVRSQAPIVLIAGDTAVTDLNNLQNVPQRELLGGTGVEFVQARSPETLSEDVAHAVRTAKLKRRPTVLNVPVDFQWSEVTDELPTDLGVWQQSFRPEAEAVETAVGLLYSANRPLIVAGRGAVESGARESILRLARSLGAPVATTLRAQGLFHGLPEDLGVYGTVAQPGALDVMLAADCVVFFGASVNRYTAAEGSLLEGRMTIHVDKKIDALNRFFPVSLGLLGDCDATANAFVELLTEAEVEKSSFAEDSAGWREKTSQPGEAPRKLDDDAALDIRDVLDRLEQAMPADRSVVTDVGRFMRHVFERVHTQEPRAFVPTVAYGSIGLGMATALGAGVGRNSAPVLLVTGDGGFMMGGLQEFTSLIRSGVDAVVVVINDGAYGAEHIQFTKRGLDPDLSTFSWPNLGQVASALGGEGIQVRTLQELDDALARIANRTRPMLIDVHVDPWKVPSSRG